MALGMFVGGGGGRRRKEGREPEWEATRRDCEETEGEAVSFRSKAGIKEGNAS